MRVVKFEKTRKEQKFASETVTTVKVRKNRNLNHKEKVKTERCTHKLSHLKKAKVRYRTVSAAVKSAHYFSKKYRLGLQRVYLCPLCGGYH